MSLDGLAMKRGLWCAYRSGRPGGGSGVAGIFLAGGMTLLVDLNRCRLAMDGQLLTAPS